MNALIKYALFLFFCFNMPSCASKKINSESENIKSNQQAFVQSDTYRLIISFISKGEGINKQIKQQIDSLIESRAFKYDKIRWGREGEVDYCFRLSELKFNEQEQFVKELKALVSDKEGVSLVENSVCIHKR